MMRPKPISLHPSIGNLVNDVTTADRELFDKNPKIKGFIRRRVAGECKSIEAKAETSGCNAVAVLRVRPGIRTRTLVYLPPEQLPQDGKSVPLVKRELRQIRATYSAETVMRLIDCDEGCDPWR